jgi:hypothetical protein
MSAVVHRLNVILVKVRDEASRSAFLLNHPLKIRQMLISLSVRCASVGESRALAQIFHTRYRETRSVAQRCRGRTIKAIPVAKFDKALISRYFAARPVFLLYLDDG